MPKKPTIPTGVIRDVGLTDFLAGNPTVADLHALPDFSDDQWRYPLTLDEQRKMKRAAVTAGMMPETVGRTFGYHHWRKRRDERLAKEADTTP